MAFRGPNGRQNLYLHLINRNGANLQTRFAEQNLKKGGTSIALGNKNSVVLATEQILDNVLDDVDSPCGSHIKIVHKNIAIVGSGHYPDINRACHFARTEVKTYSTRYHKDIELAFLARRVGDFVHSFTLQTGTRPFGCELIAASWMPQTGTSIFKISSNGDVSEWVDCAIGKATVATLKEFNKYKFQNMDMNGISRVAGKLIHQAHLQNRFKRFQFRLAVIGRANGGMWDIDPPVYFSNALDGGAELLDNLPEMQEAMQTRSRSRGGRRRPVDFLRPVLPPN